MLKHLKKEVGPEDSRNKQHGCF